MNNKMYIIEVLGSESRVTGAYTRGNTLEPYPAECIAGAAEAVGWEARVLQIGSMTDEEIVADIVAFGASVVGMTVFTCSLSHAERLASAIKLADSEIVVVVGGYHPSLVPGIVEYADFDFAVIGEGEITVQELLGQISGGQHYECADGIAFVENGCLIQTTPRQRVIDLDSLPKPKRVLEYLCNARQYGLSYPSPDVQQAVAEIGCSRGCPNVCEFCVSNVQWVERHGVNRTTQSCVSCRSAKSVVEEIGELRDRHGVRHLYLTDLTFNQDRNRVFEICEAMIEAGLHDAHTEMSGDHVANSVHWYALVKVGLDDEMARIMARAGCAKIGMGVESFCTAQVSSFVKPYQGTEILRSSLEAADRCGIINRCLLVFGSEDETWETVEETVRGLKRYAVDQIRVSFLTPFPGTRIAGKLESKSGPNLDVFDTDHPVVHAGGLTAKELVEARAYIGRSFYGSEEYEERCSHKLERFPWLKDSYRWWFEFLYKGGIADLRSIV